MKRVPSGTRPRSPDTNKLVGEAESRARAAEERAKEIEQRAEARRIESERTATDTDRQGQGLADKTVNDARAEAHRVLSEARTEAELTTNPPAGRSRTSLGRRTPSPPSWVRCSPVWPGSFRVPRRRAARTDSTAVVS